MCIGVEAKVAMSMPFDAEFTLSFLLVFGFIICCVIKISY